MIFNFEERPEEVIDNRSLFEQLQEQKEKAQQEHDEKYNLSKNNLELG